MARLSALARAALCALVLGAAALPAASEAEAQQPKPAAKTDTRGLLDRAQDLFDEQRYEESIQTLSAALVRPGKSLEDRIETYRLLAYNYITLGRSEEADAAVRGLLVLKQDFELSPKESPRFRDFFAKVKKEWADEGKPGLEQATEAAPEVAIRHTPPVQVEPGSVVKVEGTVDDPEAQVAEVKLFFRDPSAEKYDEKALAFSMGAFRGQIPQAAVEPPLVEYYLLALDAKGLPLASRGDADAPLRIAVPEPQDDSIFVSPWFWIPVGVLVVGGAVATAVIVASQDDAPPGGSGTPTSTVVIGVGE
jgi:hypothetical protein